MNVKEGWEPVCKLLGQPIPNCGFPFRNKGGKNGQTEEFLDELMQSHIRRCKIEVASAILIIFAIPVLLAYLFQPNIDILFNLIIRYFILGLIRNKTKNWYIQDQNVKYF